MESKHTKGKWIARDLEIIGPYGTNKHVCEITGNFMDEDEGIANAKRIVECVNNYDALKEENERLKNIAYDLTGKVADLKDIREQENFKNERLKEALKFALNTGDFINDHYDHIKSVLKLCTDKEDGNNEEKAL